MDVKDIKNNLKKELDLDSINFDKILVLASELAKKDADNVRFSIDASHISRLGRELVSKQETAVAELIKNAYDADATYIKIIFIDSAAPGGTLIIEDNGCGMNREQLVNGFMRISTKDKSENPFSAKYKRQRAGRKGIGRFSAQRLGSYLEILTRREDEAEGLILEIDWGRFEKSGDLIFVSNSLKQVSSSPIGTRLIISGLKDSWSFAQIQRAYRYVSELIQPFSLPFAPEKEAGDPGFVVEFYQRNGEQESVVADEQSSILDNAYAVFSGYVDGAGTPYYSIESSRFSLNINDEILKPDTKVRTVFDAEISDYSNLAGVSFRAYYFIDDMLPTGSRGAVRNVLRNHGGMKVYRNGFRVLPYGEPKDDWLGLQRSSALRQLLPPHHNSNFLGFVQLNDVDGVNFEETASREGLIENSAFFQLQDFLYKALMRGVITIAHARERKVFSTDNSVVKIKKIAPSPVELVDEIKVLIDDLSASASTSGGEGWSSSTTERITDITKKAEQLGDVSETLLKEIGMLRVLASLGLTIGEFTHETRHVLAALSAGVLELADGRPSEETLKILKNNISSLQAYMRYFDKAVTQNAQRTLETHEIRDLLADFEQVILPPLKRQHVSLDVNVSGYDLFVKPSHRSEWASIFFNLFTNSLKAINRAQVAGRIKISAGEVDDKYLFIEFSDNGDGISQEHRDKVFDAFFTTTTAADALADDETQITGSGLGLKIIKDIIEDAGGDVYIQDPSSGYSTCVRIEYPRASDEEIPDELR
ncbi:sensor histidine kinase [Pseudomonas aeruginosa]|uniref:sensor histidine kinase n=1 Tax=Pseudomonas aeruginosa TaxID=287 RepID=UPI000F52A5BF|nr:ATP-binding protein [Pseudomonas aeruginosa]MDU0606250.1 ATP-binding protein [Pseudomonas aeruginosa]RQF23164.1 ATP-binding protein [Pseudomonas aeruginosa]HDQ4554783.1 ATP-binding protein [Pseudomonas aeruginosa]